jgi:hypothetical protein
MVQVPEAATSGWPEIEHHDRHDNGDDGIGECLEPPSRHDASIAYRVWTVSDRWMATPDSWVPSFSIT